MPSRDEIRGQIAAMQQRRGIGQQEERQPLWKSFAQTARKAPRFLWDMFTRGERLAGEDIGGAIRAQAMTEAQGAKRSAAQTALMSLLGPIGIAWEAGVTPLKRQYKDIERTRQNTLAQQNRMIGEAQTPEARNKWLRMRQETAGQRPDALKEVDTLRKSPKQILGDFAELGLDLATVGTAPGILKGVRGLPRALAAGAGLGAAYGTAGGMQEDASTIDTLKQAGIGALIGGGLGAGAHGAGKLFERMAARRAQKVATKQPAAYKTIGKLEVTPGVARGEVVPSGVKPSVAPELPQVKTKTGLTQADLDELQYGIPTKKTIEPVKRTPEMPKSLADRSMLVSDIQGNPREQVVFKKIEKTPTESAKKKVYNTMPDYNGWEKVYKPYGEQGKGFYYTKQPGTAPSVVATSQPTRLKFTGQTGEAKIPVRVAQDAGLADLAISRQATKPGLKESAKKTIFNLKRDFLNRFEPVKQMSAKHKAKYKLNLSDDPYVLLKRHSSASRLATKKLDDEVSPILQRTKNLEDFDSFLVSERMNELATRGMSPRADKALNELRIKVGNKEFGNFQQMAQDLYAYQGRYLDELTSLGVLSKEQLARIKSVNQKYVPFQRVMDELEQAGFMPSAKDLNVKTSGIKRIKGSTREIVSPLESVVRNTYALTETIERQRALRALRNLGVVTGEMKKIDAKMAPVATVATEEGAKTIFRPSKFEPTAPHITLFENGQRAYYETSKEIADMVKGINEESLNLATKIMSVPARVLRATATSLNVGFAVPNIIRDQLSAAVNSKYGGIPIYDWVSGLASVLKKDKEYQRWLASGADMSSFFSQDRATLQRTVKELGRGGKWATAGRIVKNPLELLRVVGELSEQGSRVGVFKRALKGAAKEGLTGMDLELAAMMEAREATIDFAQRGAKMKALNAIIPFLNARTQGTLKLLESFAKRPVQSLAIGGAIAGVPAGVLYAYNSLYPEYDELPDYIKQNNFIIMTGNEKVPFVKIPKGEIGQIFGNVTESFLAFLKTSDPASFKDLATNLIGSISPVDNFGDVIPVAIKVPMELLANYDTFRERNIVSPYKKDLPQELQFDDDTSETMKLLGKLVGYSPAKLEHGVRGVTSGVGQQALQLSDFLAFGKKAPGNELPVINRFMGEKKDFSKTAQEIYQAEETRKAETARQNYEIKQLIREGIQNNDQSMLRIAQLMAPKSFKSFFKDALEEIQGKDLSPTEKAIQSLPKRERVRRQIKAIQEARGIQ